jgi:hypothetical protein
MNNAGFLMTCRHSTNVNKGDLFIGVFVTPLRCPVDLYLKEILNLNQSNNSVLINAPTAARNSFEILMSKNALPFLCFHPNLSLPFSEGSNSISKVIKSSVVFSFL